MEEFLPYGIKFTVSTNRLLVFGLELREGREGGREEREGEGERGKRGGREGGREGEREMERREEECQR